KHTPHDLAGCLHALYAILMTGKEPGAASHDPGLRITIHVPTENGQKLQQVLDYVGAKRGETVAGSKLPAQCGIIGKAFREKQICTAKRKNQDYMGYVRELVQEWGFTEADANKRHPASMAWMAIP